MPRIVAIWIVVCLTFGCAGGPKPARDEDQLTSQLNQGYTLLHTLLEKDGDVDKILLIKTAHPTTETIIREIALLCRTAVKQLEEFARADSTLRFDSPSVPAVEQATRDAIEGTVAKGLLGSWGESFEVKLLLSQADAIGYATHLAWTLAKFDVNPERRAYLDQLAGQFDRLYDRIVARLALTTEGSDELQTVP